MIWQNVKKRRDLSDDYTRQSIRLQCLRVKRHFRPSTVRGDLAVSITRHFISVKFCSVSLQSL